VVVLHRLKLGQACQEEEPGTRIPPPKKVPASKRKVQTYEYGIKSPKEKTIPHNETAKRGFRIGKKNEIFQVETGGRVYNRRDTKAFAQRSPVHQSGTPAKDLENNIPNGTKRKKRGHTRKYYGQVLWWRKRDRIRIVKRTCRKGKRK